MYVIDFDITELMETFFKYYKKKNDVYQRQWVLFIFKPQLAIHVDH